MVQVQLHHKTIYSVLGIHKKAKQYYLRFFILNETNIHNMLRIGSGVDFHQLVEGRELWLGGVLIPHSKGALGHSDADVLLHALCDALLGALCLGDIGTHFPDTSSEFKGIDSKVLLRVRMNWCKVKDINW
jgi:2C-methyl-D-erythritol 2,4-cyclodiphosphate synthase